MKKNKKIFKNNNFKLYDIKFNSYNLNKLILKYFKKGEKNKIFKIFYNTLKKFKRYFNYNFILFLQKIIIKNRPLFFFKKISIAGEIYEIPKNVTEFQKKNKVFS
jgi:ribosomal protein S7